MKSCSQIFICWIRNKNVVLSLNSSQICIQTIQYPGHVCAQNVETVLPCNLQQPKTLKSTHLNN